MGRGRSEGASIHDLVYQRLIGATAVYRNMTFAAPEVNDRQGRWSGVEQLINAMAGCLGITSSGVSAAKRGLSGTHSSTCWHRQAVQQGSTLDKVCWSQSFLHGNIIVALVSDCIFICTRSTATTPQWVCVFVLACMCACVHVHA